MRTTRREFLERAAGIAGAASAGAFGVPIEVHRKRGVGVRGAIGLQIHANDELRLRFKDLRIKEL